MVVLASDVLKVTIFTTWNCDAADCTVILQGTDAVTGLSCATAVTYNCCLVVSQQREAHALCYSCAAEIWAMYNRGVVVLLTWSAASISQASMQV